MKALRNHENAARFGIIQSAGDSVTIPIIGTISGNLGIGVLRLDRVIDDDEVTAAARQRTANGRVASVKVV
ncbi:hypothetical protein [Sphingopyxis terrae]|uniref:hypothetical protein n=1 Tax=Sphingopyxis terrae TaxID=33052 RepID=UPI000787D94A|nr:hypothetical protein [Sphingopyxis terrae]